MPEKIPYRFRLVVIGVSAGGLHALSELLGGLSADFPLPVLVVQHMGPDPGNDLAMLLDSRVPMRVVEANEHDTALPGTVYLAPPNYHLMTDKNATLSLSVDAPVNYARPSIDVLFESSAVAFGEALIAVILTGANMDGSNGVRLVRQHGGIVIVQDPKTAEIDTMPAAAIEAAKPDYVAGLKEIAGLLQSLSRELSSDHGGA